MKFNVLPVDGAPDPAAASAGLAGLLLVHVIVRWTHISYIVLVLACVCTCLCCLVLFDHVAQAFAMVTCSVVSESLGVLRHMLKCLVFPSTV